MTTIVLLDRDTNRLEKLKIEIDQISNSNNIKYYVCDIKNKATIKHIFFKYKPKYVLHFAGYTNLNSFLKFPQEAVENNLQINQIVCDLCIQNNVEKLFYLTSKTKENQYYFIDVLSLLSELLLYSNTLNSKTNFISLRIGRQPVVENLEKYIELFPNLLIENDSIDNIVECIIEMIIEINQTTICIYNSQDEVDLKEYFRNNFNQIFDSYKNEEKTFFGILPFDGKSNLTTHNKILFNKNELYKIVDIQKLITKILSQQPEFGITNSSYLDSIKKIITSEYHSKKYLRIIQ